MHHFEQELRSHVPKLTDDDIEKIMIVTRNRGKSLQSIAQDITDDSGEHFTIDMLKSKLGKLYHSPEAPGINVLPDLRNWIDGKIANPFKVSINIVDVFSALGSMDEVAFGYGSVLVPHSLARSTGQEPSGIEYIPAQLYGYVAEWGAPSSRLNYVDTEWRSLDDVDWLWLTIRRTGNPNDVVFGALTNFNGPQYRKVRDRERHYLEVNVASDIREKGVPVKSAHNTKYKRVIAFAPDSFKLGMGRSGRHTAVRAGYFNEIQEYLEKLHPGLGVRLPELPPGVELLEANQADDRIVQQYWKVNHKNRLDNYHSGLDKELYLDEITRQSGQGFETIPFVSRPYFLNRQTYERAARVSELAVSLSVKAHHLVLEDPKLFALNGYTQADRRLNDSRLANSGSDWPVVTRVDITIVGDTPIVFEVNADSPAGMFHMDELVKRQWRDMVAGSLTGDLSTVVEPPGSEGVCDAIVEAFVRGWELYSERRQDPAVSKAPRRIAIIDTNISAVASYTEFEHFQKLMLKRIYGKDINRIQDRNQHEVVILDAKDLRYREEHKELVDSSGRPIDAVYKRLLWKDALAEDLGDLSDPLCRAYLDDAVFVMNSFRSRLVGSKLNMAIAKSPSFEARCMDIGIELTDDERDALEHNIPDTFLWGPDSMDDRDPEKLRENVMTDVSAWVLKGLHGMGGREFIDGAPSVEPSPIPRFRDVWKEGSFIAQRHQDHGMASVPIFENRNSGTVWHRYPFILGAYVIDGKCVGIEAKVSSRIPINVGLEAKRTAVFSLKE